MTHEEFLGIKPDDGITLTDEERAAIERTFTWQKAKMGDALREFFRAAVETWPMSWLVRRLTEVAE